MLILKVLITLWTLKKINFRERPELYRIGRGEQGVLLVEPYKSEILPFWKFADEDKAREF